MLLHVAVFIFTLILQGHIKTVNHAKEIGITVCGQTGSAFRHEVIGLRQAVTAELGEHIGVCGDVIQRTQVTTVIKRTKIFQFNTRKCQARFLRRVAFCFVTRELCFPTSVARQLIVNLRFTLKAKTNVSLVTILRVIITEVVHCFYFAVHVQFITVFIINFCCVNRCGCNYAHYH